MYLENVLLHYLSRIHGFSSSLDLFFIYVAQYSSYFFAVIFFAAAGYQVYKRLKHRHKILWSSLLLLPMTLLANNLIRELVSRSRPFAAIEEFNSLIYHYYSNSFPSNHAAASFAVAGAIYMMNPIAGKISFVLATIVSFSRIYVGVHYPSDVIVGGALALVFLCLIFRKKEPLEAWLQSLEHRIIRWKST